MKERITTNRHGAEWKKITYRMKESVKPMAKKLTQIEIQVDETIGALIIRLPLGNPQPSASGKTIVIASTRGNLRTTTQFQGKPITIGANAYIPKD